MEDYIERMIQEKRELDEKIVKLVAFRYSEKGDELLDPGQRSLMERQFAIMTTYSDILRERICNEKAKTGKYDDEKCQTCAGNLGCC